MQAEAVKRSDSAMLEGDLAWARSNLRMVDGRLALDVANCLRIIELHPDYKGRFRFNEVLSKVLDRGSVMIEWRIIEFAADLQERFLPEIPVDIVAKALVAAANRAEGKK